MAVKNTEKLKTALKALVRDSIREEGKTQGKEAAREVIAPLSMQRSNFMEQINATGNQRDLINKGTQGIGVGRFVRAMAFGRGDSQRALAFAKKAWNDDLGDIVQKALQAQDLTAGGALIPPAMAAEVIELLRAKAVIRAAGARVLPMPRGTLTMRKQTGTVTGSYVGESTDITKTQPTTGLLTLTAKKLSAIVPISNDLLAYDADVTADQFVRDDLVQSLARREDQAFIRDNGTSETPRGLRYWVAAGNVSNSNGTSSANIEADFKDCINGLTTNNVGMVHPVWLMHPTRKNFLTNLRDPVGFLLYPELRTNTPTIYGYPVFTTTNIPANLSGTQSELYFVDMNEAIIGEATTLEIAVDQSASYVDSGSLVSAFSRDETLMRAIARHDFAVRHPEAIAIKTAVAWGT